LNPRFVEVADHARSPFDVLPPAHLARLALGAVARRRWRAIAEVLLALPGSAGARLEIRRRRRLLEECGGATQTV